MARIEWYRVERKLSLDLSQEIEFGWSPNLHLKLLTLVEEIKAFNEAFRQPAVGKH